ncbi:aminotransferase class V-fold PLP-dependent enzyme [Streptomyces sp. DSM 44915]|uniref:Aminotransferase class V-fold PLP-dependent enzyme n=1 Tax=Streptomyces chisholmiae TaxID=3075540 RepID=A0ABU2JUV2_9ACTN|nr:aminotransferase class V-fold PLP-dependent enzyme [Streptomyces sp. DSM 44915]MDT0268524.1 aminotransferase class V-fold PLP-dependent enzyme [Streptomyces sp. DSM 44915]
MTDAELAPLRDWQRELRAQFPIITAHPELAYLDSAATAQKPRAVLDAAQEYLVTGNANAGRGTYPWANRTTAALAATRARVAEFLGDPDPARSTVHLVSGTSEGLRSVALDWLVPQLAPGDEILVPFADHQANLAPWREAERALARAGVGITVRGLPYQDSSGDYDHRALRALVGPRTRFVAATHVHHVLGGDMNVHRLREVLGPEVPICLDAAQGVGHLPLSVAELDVDFVVFSGHKALALPGTGAVWARQARGPAYRPGGWQGTPNTVGAVSLAAALDWLTAADVRRIERWTVGLAARLTEGLRRLPQYEVLGCQLSLAADSAAARRRGIVSFRHRDITSADLGFVLYSHGYMVRADALCRAGVDPADERAGVVRVSTHVYNTPEEIDGLLSVLDTLD